MIRERQFVGVALRLRGHPYGRAATSYFARLSNDSIGAATECRPYNQNLPPEENPYGHEDAGCVGHPEAVRDEK